MDSRSGNHWLKVKLKGVRSNRTAIGARVYVRSGGQVQAQQVHSQDSYLSVSDLRLHFGLGSARRADSVRVEWPSGSTEILANVGADQLVHVEEGRGIVRSERFRGNGA